MSISRLQRAIVALVCTSTFVVQAVSQCQNGEFDYLVYAGKKNRGVTWAAAENFCSDPNGFNGELTSLHCDEEAAFIRTELEKQGKENTQYWVGGQRTADGSSDSSWKWSDGTQFSSSFESGSMWRPGEPSSDSEKCLQVKPDGLWNDALCNSGRVKATAVCKRRHNDVKKSLANYDWECREEGGERCCYKYHNIVLKKKLNPDKTFTRLHWQGARDFCKADDSFSSDTHLATISSKAENKFVKNLIYKVNNDLDNRPVWIGGKRVSFGEFTWDHDGKTFPTNPHGTGGETYSNWRAGEPNDKGETEDCLQMTHALKGVPGDWNDASCDKSRGWVCEFCEAI